MSKHFRVFALISGLCALLLTGCSNTQVGTIQISPTSQSLAAGQTAQLTATGIIGHGTHPSSSEDVTSRVTWASSSTDIATVSSAGAVTAVSAGTATITASLAGSTSGTATVTVTGAGGGTTNANVTAVAVIPGSQAVAMPTQTSQYIAIGTTSSGATRNVSNLVTWSSSSQQIGTVNATGLATAVSQGTTTISALYTNPDKSVATGTATFQVVGSSTQQITALSIYPTSQSATQSQQTQFFVLGTQGSSGLETDLSSKVVWSSSNPAIAKVATSGDGSGLAPGTTTALSPGTTMITATYTNQGGVTSEVVAQATYTVSAGAAGDLLSINVVPADVTVSNKGMTAQYLAFGNYSSGAPIRDITNLVTWFSALPEVASINTGGAGTIGGEQAGLATSQGYTGNSVIYAEMQSSNGSMILSNPQTFTCMDSNTQVCIQTVPTPQFSTVTVFIQGNQTASSGEYVTAPSGTGTPNLIHCGSQYPGTGGSVCTGTYAVGSTVVLTENLQAGSASFGGWSSGAGCQEANPATSTTCTIKVNGNASVGVIFY